MCLWQMFLLSYTYEFGEYTLIYSSKKSVYLITFLQETDYGLIESSHIM